MQSTIIDSAKYNDIVQFFSISNFDRNPTPSNSSISCYKCPFSNPLSAATNFSRMAEIHIPYLIFRQQTTVAKA